jgi:truncated hemoglobin YjbI
MIVGRFYSSIFEDPVLQPVFGHPVPTHVDDLTAFLAEEFGGPTRYSDELGGFPAVVPVHRGRRITEAQRQRFVEVFMAAVDQVGFASDTRFRTAIAARSNSVPGRDGQLARDQRRRTSPPAGDTALALVGPLRARVSRAPAAARAERCARP